MKNTSNEQVRVARWRDITNYKSLPTDFETTEGRSMTVPDLNTDLKTILSKFTRGEIATLNDYETEDEDAAFTDLDIESFQRMELNEQSEFLQHAKDTIESFQRAKYAAERKILENKNTSKSEEEEPQEVTEKPRKKQENEEKKKRPKQPENED